MPKVIPSLLSLFLFSAMFVAWLWCICTAALSSAWRFVIGLTVCLGYWLEGMARPIRTLIFLCVLPCALAATLEWDRNPETNVIGYRVYVGRVARLYDSVLDIGNQISTQVPVSPGTTYFAVTAYDSDGLESDYSEEVFYTLPCPDCPTNEPPVLTNGPPAIVQGVQLVNGFLTWSANTETNLTGYFVHFSHTTNFAERVINMGFDRSVELSALAWTFEPVTYFWVYAISADGFISAPSAVVSFPPQPIVIVSLQMVPGRLLIYCSMPGMTYDIYATSDLNEPFELVAITPYNEFHFDAIGDKWFFRVGAHW